MVVLAHFDIRTDWLISTSSSMGAEGESWFSISHLLPSSAFFGCFFGSAEAVAAFCWDALLFWRMLGGLGLISGTGLREREMSEVEEAVEADLSGTVEVARREGFLCVICDLSTFFNPEVTDMPRLSCSNMAPISEPSDVADLVVLAWALGSKVGRGGGGGGGGGAPPDEGVGVAPLVAPFVVGEASGSAPR